MATAAPKVEREELSTTSAVVSEGQDQEFVKALEGAGLEEVKGTFIYEGKPLWWNPSFLGMFTDPYAEGGFLHNQIQGDRLPRPSLPRFVRATEAATETRRSRLNARGPPPAFLQTGVAKLKPLIDAVAVISMAIDRALAAPACALYPGEEAALKVTRNLLVSMLRGDKNTTVSLFLLWRGRGRRQAVGEAFVRFGTMGKAIMVVDGGDGILGSITQAIDAGLGMIGSSSNKDAGFVQVLEEIVRNVK